MGNYKFFQNLDCEYFPCHKGVAREDFNCLFCFCPLYSKGMECGGNFELVKGNIKSCMNCERPHRREAYDTIMSILKEDLKK